MVIRGKHPIMYAITKSIRGELPDPSRASATNIGIATYDIGIATYATALRHCYFDCMYAGRESVTSQSQRYDIDTYLNNMGAVINIVQTGQYTCMAGSISNVDLC